MVSGDDHSESKMSIIIIIIVENRARNIIRVTKPIKERVWSNYSLVFLIPFILTCQYFPCCYNNCFPG